MTQSYNLTTELVDRHLEAGDGGRVAIREGSRSLSYHELAELVARVGHRLLSDGVRPGSRVLIALPDGAEFAAAYLGSLRVGAIAVLCNPASNASDFELFVRESRAAALIADAATLPRMVSSVRAEPMAPTPVSVGGPFHGAVAWDEWLADPGEQIRPAPTAPDDAAFWLWTSGSTGHPRAVVHRHRDWGPCIEGFARRILGVTGSDVCFSAAKSFHAYGLGGGTVFPLAMGARTVYLRGRPSPESIFDQLAQERPTVFYGVPTMYAAMLAYAERASAPDVSSLRRCISAGEPLPAEIYRRWKDRFGLEILDGIGSTEVLHVYLSSRAGRVHPGSTGTPVPGYEVRIVDEHGQDVGPNIVGDLWVRAPSLASGYSVHSKITPLRMHGDWFVTGDKFLRDADGYYWYVGRADDMFKSRAEWVSPISVEGALIEHPAVLEAAVVGRADDEGLLHARAFVVLKPGHGPSEALVRELWALSRSRLSAHAQPYWIEFLPELPKSSTGKLLRYQLRTRALVPGAVSPPAPIADKEAGASR